MSTATTISVSSLINSLFDSIQDEPELSKQAEIALLARIIDTLPRESYLRDILVIEQPAIEGAIRNDLGFLPLSFDDRTREMDLHRQECNRLNQLHAEVTEQCNRLDRQKARLQDDIKELATILQTVSNAAGKQLRDLVSK